MGNVKGIWVPDSGPIGKLADLFATFASSIADAIAAGTTPPGSIVAYGGTTPPAGWLLCDGTQYATTSYPKLFAAIGYLHGGASGNFRVPNMTKRVPVGIDGSNNAYKTVGLTGGEETHKLTTAELPAHDHNFVEGSQTVLWGYGGTVSFVGTVAVAAPASGNQVFVKQGTWGKTVTSGADTPHNNMQPFVVVNYIVKT